MEIEIVQYTFVSSILSQKLFKLSKLNGKEYRKYFDDILDGMVLCQEEKYTLIMVHRNGWAECIIIPI